MRNNHLCRYLKDFRGILFKTLLIVILFTHSSVILSGNGQLQKADRKISGTIKDQNGDPIPSATVLIKGTTIGASSDLDGSYSIVLTNQKEILVFMLLGYVTQEVVVDANDKTSVDIVLEEDTKMMDEVVVVGFGTQKKESMVSAISTINVKELKGPTSNLTTMLAGRIAGVISFQRSGEPGKDDAQFFVRGIGSFGAGKVNPLILIDGIESSSTDLSRLQPDDIASFSVLKDATATSVYGARGANGVIVVFTKGGEEGKTKFSFRLENSISTNTRNFKFADNITYMEKANEAALTRYPGSSLVYSQDKIDRTRAGDDPYLYPNNNWIDQMISPYTMNQRFNMNISGGGGIAKYYIGGTFNVDNGVLKNDKLNNFKNNVKLKNYSVRSNTTLQLTRSTELTVRVHGQFDDYTGPIGGGGAIFRQTIWSNPVAFAAIYPASYSPYMQHPLFGSAVVPGSNDLYTNPYANMVSGFQMYKTANVTVQGEFNQNLDFITSGLSLRGMGYTHRFSWFETTRKFSPFYYNAERGFDGTIRMQALNDGTQGSKGPVGSEYLTYDRGGKSVNSVYYGEMAGNYNRTFDKVHAISGMLIGILRNFDSGNEGAGSDITSALPSRNLGLSGRFTYGYDSRYMLELNFGYNGSERFAKNHRWGFFPSIGTGWNISNEAFFKPLNKTVSNLKIRGSYGLVGNDQIGNVHDRFFYMSNVNLNAGEKGSVFGYDWKYYRPGISQGRYANEKIGWERSKQTNIGLEANVLGVGITVDGYQQKRTNILMNRSYIPGTLGLQATPQANVGKASTKGVDLGLDYNKNFRNGIWTQLRGNLTYATSKKEVVDEINYPANEWYRSEVGLPINQPRGLIAERLFVDDFEVANSPRQFGEYQAGDIKYRDVNRDGQITDEDMVPIGLPYAPEIIYGFGGTIGYKQFDFNAFFQGAARTSFLIKPELITPFVKTGGAQNGLLKHIADDHWSEDNRNLYAFWPRLKEGHNDNNNKPSTWWLRDGSFLRLKTVEVGYNLPDKHAKKLGISNLRLYVNGSNLFSISNFKMWDTEMGPDGLGYPVQQVYNIGISFGI